MSRSHSSLLVIGGTYAERCEFPRYEEVYGSGLRAASVLANTGIEIKFRTVANEEFERHARLKSASFGFDLEVTQSDIGHRFWYLHTLAGGELAPAPSTHVPSLTIDTECALQFGMVDATAKIRAKSLVYDPQSPALPSSLLATGSIAERVAIVLNRREAFGLTGNKDISGAAQQIRRMDNASVVVIKDGPRGAFVCDLSGESWVPVFVTPRCFLLGSGDVFSAIFAREWAVKGAAPIEAATAASVAAASWCDSTIIPLQEDIGEIGAIAKKFGQSPSRPRLYLAGPFFCAAQLWWVAHARRVLTDLGFSVFSPYHDIGVADLANADIAKQDIAALKRCEVVFALLDGLDPGTLFEIGVARTHGIPVVGLRTEGSFGLHETMLQGTGCTLFDDFGSAAYHAFWAASGSEV